MKRKYYPWIGVLAFLMLVLLGPLLAFPRLQSKLEVDIQEMASYKALPAKKLDWHGRNAYLSVPEGYDDALLSMAIEDMEALRGVRAVEVVYAMDLDQGVEEAAEPVAQATTQTVEETTEVPQTTTTSDVEMTTSPPETEPPTTLSAEDMLMEGQQALDQVLALNTIEFDFGTAELTEASKTSVMEIAKVLSVYPDMKVQVIGHTDSVGTQKNNQIKSLERAQAVVDELIINGIDEERLRVEGKGEDEPIASNETEEGRKLNRRVELTGLEN